MSLSYNQKIQKFLTPILLPLVKLYWQIFKPTTFGAKVIIEHNGKFLIIKHDYGYKSFGFPGGKMNKGETPEQTAKRETLEEVGITLNEVKYLGVITSNREGKKDNIYIFYAKSPTSKIVLDEFEISEGHWLTKNELPKFLPVTQKIWDFYLDKESAELKDFASEKFVEA